MSTLKHLLQTVIDMLDDDEFESLSREELEQISMLIHRPITMGREAAAKFLGISLNKFHDLRDSGVILPPKKRKGFKEKEYYLSDLRKSLEIIQVECL